VWKNNSTGGERFRQRMLRREKRAEDDGYLINDPSKTQVPILIALTSPSLPKRA